MAALAGAGQRPARVAGCRGFAGAGCRAGVFLSRQAGLWNPRWPPNAETGAPTAVKVRSETGVGRRTDPLVCLLITQPAESATRHRADHGDPDRRAGNHGGKFRRLAAAGLDAAGGKPARCFASGGGGARRGGLGWRHSGEDRRKNQVDHLGRSLGAACRAAG
jgi:hypothetical protein